MAEPTYTRKYSDTDYEVVSYDKNLAEVVRYDKNRKEWGVGHPPTQWYATRDEAINAAQGVIDKLGRNKRSYRRWVSQGFRDAVVRDPSVSSKAQGVN